MKWPWWRRSPPDRSCGVRARGRPGERPWRLRTPGRWARHIGFDMALLLTISVWSGACDAQVFREHDDTQQPVVGAGVLLIHVGDWSGAGRAVVAYQQHDTGGNQAIARTERRARPRRVQLQGQPERAGARGVGELRRYRAQRRPADGADPGPVERGRRAARARQGVAEQGPGRVRLFQDLAQAGRGGRLAQGGRGVLWRAGPARPVAADGGAGKGRHAGLPDAGAEGAGRARRAFRPRRRRFRFLARQQDAGRFRSGPGALPVRVDGGRGGRRDRRVAGFRHLRVPAPPRVAAAQGRRPSFRPHCRRRPDRPCRGSQHQRDRPVVRGPQAHAGKPDAHGFFGAPRR
ncbi:Uncharacterised protein [Achromobacter xylosoxidans]|nr:Uncharacterised protein [Achromobacter xylosoxidans]